MTGLEKKVAYIQGLLEGMHLDKNDDNTKLLTLIVDAIGDMAGQVDAMEESVQELNDYVESIDDDLGELEGKVGKPSHSIDTDDDDDDFMDEDFDEDDEDDDAGQNLRLLHHHHHDHDCDCGCEHDDEDEDEDDEDVSFDNLFMGCLCPECGHLFCVTDPDFDDENALYECPFCHKHVHLTPMDPEHVPVARRVDTEG